jgi:1,2-diacylglycerol 3-alpha-glucosyltransferase
MNILITTPSFPPFNSGLGNAVQMQCKLITSLGHKVTVATYGDKNSPKIDVTSGAYIKYFDVSGANYLLKPIKGNKAEYVAFLENNSFDLVILNAWQNWATDLALINIKKISGKVYVFSHCLSVNSVINFKLIRSLISYIMWRPYWYKLGNNLKKLNGVIFLSDDGCDSRFDDLKLAKKLNSTFHIIPNALSNSSNEALFNKATSRSAREHLVSVGSYDWFKGHDFVIRSYSESVAKNIIKLKIFGQKFNIHTSYLRNLAVKLGIKNEYIEFFEGVSGTALIAEYEKSIIFLYGSYTECQPLVLLDSIATGTPYISRRSGSIPCILGGYSVKSITEAAIRINELISDHKTWEKFSITGKNYAIDNHSQESVKFKLNKFLNHAELCQA